MLPFVSSSSRHMQPAGARPDSTPLSYTLKYLRPLRSPTVPQNKPSVRDDRPTKVEFEFWRLIVRVEYFKHQSPKSSSAEEKLRVTWRSILSAQPREDGKWLTIDDAVSPDVSHIRLIPFVPHLTESDA